MNISELGDIYISSGRKQQITATGKPSTGDGRRIENTPEPAERIDAYAPNTTNDEDNVAQTEFRDQSEIRDEYIPSPTVMRNAIYNVSDVQTDTNEKLIKAPEIALPAQGNLEVPDKITDIILSMGKKLLSIFKNAD